MSAVETVNLVTHTVNILDHHMTRVTVDLGSSASRVGMLGGGLTSRVVGRTKFGPLL